MTFSCSGDLLSQLPALNTVPAVRAQVESQNFVPVALFLCEKYEIAITIFALTDNIKIVCHVTKAGVLAYPTGDNCSIRDSAVFWRVPVQPGVAASF